MKVRYLESGLRNARSGMGSIDVHTTTAVELGLTDADVDALGTFLEVDVGWSETVLRGRAIDVIEHLEALVDAAHQAYVRRGDT